ncbi:PREDICTED: nucleoside diphosphate kinase homolog 5-like [Amphimedon queenslandica]|uniref:Nucleoside diphosphate kinase homolog 5 n=1 Tax=Amphimedon queenslandica TaxID=400682 RepID=A0A1X7TL27_AMPQE|nr:PREDICTED: nucleoside diphosphate kinase homolog 5-like [Amphimedon queenslandica]|eukprot:XP_003390308.1 PREDICTED: nucleoside diphosphate kinase homolog 5-like [Amphimedon queenslandica]
MADITVEKTLALIKPDAMNWADEIIEEIKRNGFKILQKRRIQLSPEEAANFYAEHYGKMFFPSLVAFMSSSDIIVMVLAKQNAIKEWKELLGPTDSRRAKEEEPRSLRACYGHDNTKNALHGSDSEYAADKEIKFMFPDAYSIMEPVERGTAMKDYLRSQVNPTLVKGLTELCHEKPDDPLEWLAQWILKNNPNKPQVETI